MTISTRIFLSYFLIVGLGVFFLLNVFMAQLRPGVRQSMEDTLVDMANLLAEVVTPAVVQKDITNSDFSNHMNDFLERRFNAPIWDLEKTNTSLRVYITNEEGIVIYDSSGLDVGKDFSQWRDVYLTLRGQYGARSTPIDPDNELTTVMHVAAPIIHENNIIGVLTVAKPNISVQPFIEISRGKMIRSSLILVVISLLAGLFLSRWFTASIRKLVTYANQVGRKERITLPKIREHELSALGAAIENMRQELDGKQYVENYIHTLTHEMKSPLSAIQGAAELMQEDMPADQRNRFLNNILNETHRLRDFIARMLNLASVEKQQALENPQVIHIKSLLEAIAALWCQ